MPNQIKQFIIRQFLNQKNIHFEGVPLFTGPWIKINNQGHIIY